MICTPAYNGLITQTYFLSIKALLDDKRGKEIIIPPPSPDSCVVRARTNLQAKFLESKCSHLFFIDSDIGFTTDHFHRTVDLDRDVACGVYPFKAYFSPNNGNPYRMPEYSEFLSRMRYVINLKNPTETIPQDGFVKVLDSPTGFMCIKRQVLEKMMDAYPELQYDNDMLGVENTNFHYMLWLPMLDHRRYLTEDYAFCRRWQAIGGDIWADMRSTLTHTGPHEFVGDIMATSHAATYQPN